MLKTIVIALHMLPNTITRKSAVSKYKNVTSCSQVLALT